MVATALTVFGVAMALDGGGIPAVKLGLAVAERYESRGSAFAHIVELSRHSPVLFAGLAGAVALWVPAYFWSRGDETSRHDERLAVWALGAATSLMTPLQYAKRGYLHYALLTLPFALIAIASAASWCWEKLRASLDPRHVGAAAAAAVVAIAVPLWAEAWTLPAAPSPPPPLHGKYLSMCAGIEPGKRLLLLPSRENAFHWACGTNARGTRWGYTFGFQERPNEYIQELAKPDLTQVFVFSGDPAHPYEQEVARRQDWSRFLAALERYGFTSAGKRAAGTLYLRAEKGDGRQ